MHIRINPNDLPARDFSWSSRDKQNYGWFLILLGLGGAIGGGVVPHGHWHTLKSYVQEPEVVTPAYLSKIESPDELSSPYVSLCPSKVIDTGVRRFIGRRGYQVNYILIPVGDRYLLTEVLYSYRSGTTLVGQLEQWQPNRNGGGILAEVKSRGYGERLLPYQFDAVADGRRMSMDLALGPLLIFGGLIFAVVGSLHFRT
jgi:hypothetical protein